MLGGSMTISIGWTLSAVTIEEISQPLVNLILLIEMVSTTLAGRLTGLNHI